MKIKTISWGGVGDGEKPKCREKKMELNHMDWESKDCYMTEKKWFKIQLL